MIIDCNDVPIGVSRSRGGLNKLKSAKLVSDLTKVVIDNEMKPESNYMIMSMNIYNIIEHSNYFEANTGANDNEDLGLYLVGWVNGLDCYVDLHMKSNNVLLYWNKQIQRDMKLESILNGDPNKGEKVEIKVII